MLGCAAIGVGIFCIVRLRRATNDAAEQNVDEIFDDIEKKQYEHDIAELEEIQSERRD